MVNSRLVALIVLLGFLVVTEPVQAQTIAPPRPSVLFGSTTFTKDELAASADTVQDKRIAHAVVFGALGAFIGGAVAGGGDDGWLPQAPAILIGAAFGAIAGYVTAGKSSDN